MCVRLAGENRHKGVRRVLHLPKYVFVCVRPAGENRDKGKGVRPVFHPKYVSVSVRPAGENKHRHKRCTTCVRAANQKEQIRTQTWHTHRHRYTHTHTQMIRSMFHLLKRVWVRAFSQREQTQTLMHRHNHRHTDTQNPTCITLLNTP